MRRLRRKSSFLKLRFSSKPAVRASLFRNHRYFDVNYPGAIFIMILAIF